MDALRAAWQAAAVGYTTSLVAQGLAGIFPDSSFLSLLFLFGLVYYFYGLWRVAKVSGKRAVFTLNLWASLIQFASFLLLGIALAASGFGGPQFTLSAGLLLIALLTYAGLVYGAYLEMQGLGLLAEVGGVPLIARGGRMVFIGALLTLVLVGLLVMLVGYLMVAVGLWQGPRLKTDA